MSVYKFDNGKIEPLKKMTGAEIMEQDQKDFEADVKAMMEEAAPKTPLEAAIDRATGFKPEDMLNVARETEQGDSETEQPETGTGKADSGTDEAASVDDLYVKKNGRYGSPKPQSKTDWVEEAYKCFIKDAGDIDPTDPVAAVEAYFQKNATDELKARCKAEGKDAKGCWRFIEAVARKALHGSSGHIDPGVVYAIAMHWFEDVPKDWDKPAPSPKAKTAKPAKSAKPKTPSEIKKEKAKAKAKAAKAKRKPKQSQGFFFEMLETPVTRAEKESEVQG